MRLDLPRALEPWRTVLSVFPPELALPIGDVVARLSVLVGPLQQETTSDRGEPDGVSGISRRGPLDRLLMTEWALLHEVPDEFLRRAASTQLAFHELARREPAMDRRTIAIFDAGASQLGGPRIVQLAALVLLAQRAVDARASFAWGVLQDPATTLHQRVSAGTVRVLLRARRATMPTAEDAERWGKALAVPAGAASKEVRELWLIGSARTPDPAPTLVHPRLVIDDSLDLAAPLALDVTLLDPRRPSRSARVDPPPAAIGTRLLRNPFDTPATDARSGIELGPGATPFVFGWHRKKLYARNARGELVTLPLEKDGTPRVLAHRPGASVVAVGVVQRKQRTVVLVRRQDCVDVRCLGRRDIGEAWNARLPAADVLRVAEGDADAPLEHLFPVSEAESFLVHGRRLLRLHHPKSALDGTAELVLPVHAAFRSGTADAVLAVTAERQPRVLRVWVGKDGLVHTAPVDGVPELSEKLAAKARVFAQPGVLALEEEEVGTFRVLGTEASPSIDVRIAARTGDEVIGVRVSEGTPWLVVVDVSRRGLDLVGPAGVTQRLLGECPEILHAQASPYGPELALVLTAGGLELRSILHPDKVIHTYGTTPRS